MGCRARHAAVADEVLKHGGRLNVGRSALCREMQVHTLPAGPIERISSGKKPDSPQTLRSVMLTLHSESPFYGILVR